MEILIFGAGVIGTIYGAVLAQTGNSVTHYVRPGKAKDLEGGISLQLLDGRSRPHRERRFTYPLRVVEEIPSDHPYGLILVSVRHYQLPSVLPVIENRIGEADVLFFNGLWEGPDEINRYVSPSKYLWGFPVAGGGFEGRSLNGALLGEVRLGELNGGSSPRLERIQGLFEQAGIKVDVPSNMLHWLWVHFAINCGVVGAAFKAGGARELLKSIPHLRKAVLAGRDALAVCRARAVDVGAFADAKPFFWPSWLGALGLWTMMKTNRPARRIFETHTAVDELQVMYHELLKTGSELHVPMPNYAPLEKSVDNPRLP